MLQDIPNPFLQVVTRNPRLPHHGGRHPGEGDGPGGVIIPVDPEAQHSEAKATVGAGQTHEGGPVAARIMSVPGPGEVAPPKWWGHKPGAQS
jgi:hypothetical protein